jgi:hypothetical protein
MRNHLFLGYSLDRELEQEKFEKWKNELTSDRLISISTDYLVPTFLQPGRDGNIVEEIRSRLEEADRNLEEYKLTGVSNSFWVQLFTSKVDPRAVRNCEEEKAKYLTLSQEIPKVEDALRLLGNAYSYSQKFANRASQIEETLFLARVKKAAIERFEEKHGKTFAKAAAADGEARIRATSLKRLVEKTADCPYCGAILGSNPHLDHIYPVSKGGLSIVFNLVWCCSTCNALKADTGLVQFLKKRGLPVEPALARLHSLGKHV